VSRRREDAARRAIDLTCATAGLAMTSPLLLVAALAVKLEDGGPVIFRRRVLARGGGQFDAYKLRTMRQGAHERLGYDQDLATEYERKFKLRHDPRVTRVGRILRKVSVDEVPQLVNVLRGQMSLVGPRMMHPPELERFGDLGPRLLEIRPGITGLWQVSGRQDLSFADRLALDREYLEKRSLWFDIKILLRTPRAVISGRGAY
jgi:lipopolysaccharide/colanic/teichoic acid biosynthesis glycosyltransferase